MALEHLDSAEKTVVYYCLKAIVEGPFLKEREFETRIGTSRDRLKGLVGVWPTIERRNGSPDDDRLIGNALYELCEGLTIKPKDWKRWVKFSPEIVGRVFKAWTDSGGWARRGVS